ncbi:MAG: hypothetical protein PHC28_09460 [Flavobacterium sp.]|uniref:hypothetical protein n=1 Tax=Flavobacterium sp. TaxID=239 RepID=UPI0026207284|nr:hypothetical protein [Flavobacterium sp.]MDD5150692.1 hypothetical protein [Flavobacterium sp.]
MKIITVEEYKNDPQYHNSGIFNFMGGFSSKDGSYILVVDGISYFFEKEEIGGEEYNKIYDLQNEEGRKYIENNSRL